METTDKHTEMLGANGKELKKIIDSMTEKEAKEILLFIMSGYNKIRDKVTEFI